MTSRISRRDVLKLAGLGLGAVAFAPYRKQKTLDFPKADYLGRVLGAVDVRSKPGFDATVVGRFYEDEIVEWNREVVSATRDLYVLNQRWVETPYGYIYSPAVQPVRNLPNTPMAALPPGENGFWAEVTVPFVEIVIDNPPIRSPWAKTTIATRQINPRLYYGQVVWMDAVRTNPTTGALEYRFNEDAPHGYGYGDIFWADASAFRMVTEEEMQPVSPGVDPAEKKIVVDITYQTLSCFEGKREVFFCRTSTGLLASQTIDLTNTYETPVGDMYTYWKIISKAMGANSSENAAGYDTPAVPWCTFIATGGVAIHGAFWHNNFGTARSHGCINVRPEDAKWIFRWTDPYVSLKQTETRMTWPTVGTKVTSIKQA
jgi:hypothetical protein